MTRVHPPKDGVALVSNDSHDAEPDESSGARPRRLTSREHRAEAEVFSTLASALVDLPPYKLDQLDLPLEIRTQVIECRPFRKNARLRQLRRIATLLRGTDVDALTAATADLQTRGSQRHRRERENERWRTRLMEDGDAALAELVTLSPGVDRQHLRQLIRAAKRAPGTGKSQRAYLMLLREVRAATEAAPIAPDEAPSANRDAPDAELGAGDADAVPPATDLDGAQDEISTDDKANPPSSDPNLGAECP